MEWAVNTADIDMLDSVARKGFLVTVTRGYRPGVWEEDQARHGFLGGGVSGMFEGHKGGFETGVE